jgi:uncharacterized membrane protein YeiH
MGDSAALVAGTCTRMVDAAGLAAYGCMVQARRCTSAYRQYRQLPAGVITACIGGVIRDITAGVPSILMRHELYVTCALLSAASFVVLTRVELAAPWPALLAFGLGFLLRGAAMRWKLTLPAHRGH